MAPETLDDISPRRKRLWGLGLMGLASVTAFLIDTHPERLRAPAWLAFLACACFATGGLAMALHGWISRRAHAWLMVLLLAAMALMPAWIALGAGPRQCLATFAVFRSEAGCRFVFGLAGLLMVAVLALAISLAMSSARKS